MPCSCALLGRFAIGARVSLLRQHSAEHKMSASACTRGMRGLLEGSFNWLLTHDMCECLTAACESTSWLSVVTG